MVPAKEGYTASFDVALDLTQREIGMTANLSVAGTRQGTRRFYVGVAIAVLITVFLGFSRSYFLKAYYGTPELSLHVHIHGLVFTSWVLLFLAQTTLVATDRTDLHRKLGVGGAVLAALLLIMGTTTAILRVKGGGSSRFPECRRFRSWLCHSSIW